MPTKKKKRKSSNKKKIVKTQKLDKVLSVCSDCKIKLIVDRSDKCFLCNSPNITISDWRKQ